MSSQEIKIILSSAQIYSKRYLGWQKVGYFATFKYISYRDSQISYSNGLPMYLLMITLTSFVNYCFVVLR